ncbi:DUF3515 domain-containing protein [Streptomyces boninensis]|uniref:DUF3515 domain-containing protein n=1 Tax=Streptomyces boninensis TaxID=2039455 RepID=UPI003B210E65
MKHYAPPVLLRTAAAGLVLAAAAACSSSGGSAQVDPPKPAGAARSACAALTDGLPKAVDGQQRRDAEPASRYTAAWGDPAIALRCGVPRPEVLRPGTAHYNPTADSVEVNGVQWLAEQQDDGYLFTALERAAFVELWVPDAYAPEVDPLTDLAASVKKAVPKTGV